MNREQPIAELLSDQAIARLQRASKALFSNSHRLQIALTVAMSDEPVWLSQVSEELPGMPRSLISQEFRRLEDLNLILALRTELHDRRRIYKRLESAFWAFVAAFAMEQLDTRDPLHAAIQDRLGALELLSSRRADRAGTEAQPSAVLPVYLAVDESMSMANNIESLNAELAGIEHDLDANPMAREVVRLSVLGFSDTPVWRQRPRVRGFGPLASPLEARGTTNYGAAFAALRKAISQDLLDFKDLGVLVRRPIILFITDGESTDPWEDALDELVRESSPTIIALGVGLMSPELLARIASPNGGAYLAGTGAFGPGALRALARATVDYLFSSGRSTSRGQPLGDFPTPEGFRRVDTAR